MKIAKWVIIGLLLTVIVAFFHYYLPQHDTVRIVGTDVKRMDVRAGEFIDEGAGNTQPVLTRDVRFIETFFPNDKERVYRNEETGWGFPWYFKFDSANIQAKANNLRSTAENPKWVNVAYYGWRIEIFSMFPNAVDISPVDGPDYRPFPWFNVAFFTFLFVIFFLIWRFLRRVRRRHIDPVIDSIEDEVAEATEAAGAKIDAVEERTKRWFGSWRSKNNRRYK